MKRNDVGSSGRALFLRRAAEMYDRMTIHDTEQLITFEQIENRALELGRQLETLAIEHCIQKAAGESQTAAAPQCPKCRGVVPRSQDRPEERRVLTRSGTVFISRAKCRCSSCRKTFFPSGHAASAWR